MPFAQLGMLDRKIRIFGVCRDRRTRIIAACRWGWKGRETWGVGGSEGRCDSNRGRLSNDALLLFLSPFQYGLIASTRPISAFGTHLRGALPGGRINVYACSIANTFSRTGLSSCLISYLSLISMTCPISSSASRRNSHSSAH